MNIKQDIIQERIAKENKVIKEACDRRKSLNEEFDLLKADDVRHQRKLTHKQNQERGCKWAEEHPEEHAAFIADIRRRNQEAVIEGFLEGWWDLDENGNMAAPAKVFHISDFAEVKNPLLAHVMAKAGIFTSIGQAKKNGWEKPLTVGEWTVTKKKTRIRIEE